MKKNLITLFVIICYFLICTTSFINNGSCQESDKVVYNQKHRYIQKHKFRKIKPGDDLQCFYLPIPPSNEYQEISNIDTHGGQIFDNPNSKQKYVRYTITNQSDFKEWDEFILEFDYIPKDTEFKTTIVDEIFPYDTTTELYKKYTSKYYGFIDTDNPALKEASGKLWDSSTDVYDYIHKCFEYVNNTFEFKDVGTGWYTISELVAKNGGDCGNLSSLFITLLRCKKVPARHVIVPGHVWAEFYLEKYGWIPVDPTLKLFGRASASHKRLIWSHEIVFQLKTSVEDSFYTNALCQLHVFYPSHNPYECDIEIKLQSIP